jgi:hypothetical protein
MAFNTQSPIHNMNIDFKNWFDFKKTHVEQIKDPLDEQFNWWYWCGFKSKEEKDNAILKYNEFKNMLPTNLSKILRNGSDSDKENVLDRLKKAAKSEGETDKYIEELFKGTKTFSVDIPRIHLKETLVITDKIYEMCFNVMFAIYSIELKKNIYDNYLQGENFILIQIVKILLSYKDKSDDEIECLLFHIQHTLLFKLHLKKMIFTMPERNKISSNDGKIPQFVFFNWLFLVMFIKKNKNKFKKLINGKSEKQVDNMFSEVVSRSFWVGWFQDINKINNTDFREIIGNVLVNRNRGGISMFFAYMISYWCGYEKLNGELWDDITFNNHDNKLNFFFSRHAQIKGKKIFEQSLTLVNRDFNNIYSYFKDNFEKIVLICTKESFTNTTTIEEGFYKWNFKLPRKFIKNKKIWDVNFTRDIRTGRTAQIGAIMGGRRKIKSKKKTLKKSNRKLNRTIKLR